jgi:hypothetical protein
LALLWVVVFFLPDWVANQPSPNAQESTPDPQAAASGSTAPPSNGVESAPAASANPSSSGDARSPFAEAQLAKARRAAQDILQPLLELQDYLLERGVDRWAADAYASAVALAETGDEAYREQDFSAATEAYQQATLVLEGLEQELPEIISTQKQQVITSMEALDLDAATAAFEQLQVMAPEDTEVAELAARLATLPNLIEALDTAENLLETDLDAAVETATRAAALDPQHQAAATLRDDYRARQRQRNFQRAMTTGYDALSREAFSDAEKSFRAAASIRPNAPEPGTALEELETARTAAQLRALRDAAQAKEAEEDWAGALARYQDALEIDNTLLFAKDGIQRTVPRATLMTAVDDILDTPERLVDPAALAAAKRTLQELQALNDSGPIYRQKREALTQTLEIAATPIEVTLSSDGLTDVTIARVRRLGSFDQQVISLRPGDYTAVGIRNGYRDVRIDFSVKPDGDMPVVDVRCLEAL